MNHFFDETNLKNINRMDMMKQRKARCVCKYCGKKLELRQIIFHEIKEARVELYCENCDRMEFGVEQEIYLSACNFIDNWGFDCYSDLDQNEKKRQMNIAKICEILTWGGKTLGILNQSGFTVPIQLQVDEMAEILEKSGDDIPDIDSISG